MPLFLFYCRDGENGAALRKHWRDAHLAHIERNIGDIALAGPLKHDDATIGSLLILRAGDESAARALFESDPYFQAGVWQSIRTEQFDGLAGDFVGGIRWDDPAQ